jgi:hypothetical protein
MPKELSFRLVETKADKTEGSEIKEMMKMPETLNPSTEATIPKTQKSSATTPKRRTMANVLDVVLETAKALSPIPSRKIAEASEVHLEAETKQAEVEAATIEIETKAGPSEPTETEPAVVEEKAAKEIASEDVEAAATEASKESIDYIIRHASGKRLS